MQLRADRLQERREGALERHQVSLAAVRGRITSLEKQLKGKCEFRDQREKDLDSERKAEVRIVNTVGRTEANLKDNAPHIKPRKAKT